MTLRRTSQKTCLIKINQQLSGKKARIVKKLSAGKLSPSLIHYGSLSPGSSLFTQ
jgi:hypothetical protein